MNEEDDRWGERRTNKYPLCFHKMIDKQSVEVPRKLERIRMVSSWLRYARCFV